MSRKKKIAFLYDLIVREYDDYMQKTGHQRAQEKILQRLYGKIKGKVLDIATGTGFLALKIKMNCPQNEVTGIDISKKMIEEAKRKAKEQRLKIEFLVADAERLNFLDQSFDWVISSLGFLWFSNQDKVLKELKRITKKGGKIVIIEEAGQTTRSRINKEKLSEKLQNFFSQIEKFETPISIKGIKKKIKNLPFRLEKEYKVPIDKYHNFVGMVFRV